MPWLLTLLLTTTTLLAQTFEDARPKDPDFFPIAVWLQSPHNAKAYQQLGINLYVGLYGGPTEAQLEALQKAEMPVICHQNEVGLKWQGDTIVGWMHGDEPDNSQARVTDGYEPPIPPPKVVEQFEVMKKADERPVLLNLGQGAAWDGWHGRGPRTNHPEDYPEYAKGGDIVSFDIYPVVHTHDDVKGRLEFVGNGVRRLREWTRGQKPIWACIETSHIGNADVRPTAEQIRSEVWMAIACGADGIIYFSHEFAPRFVEAGLLQYDDVKRELKALNAEVLALAKVLNGERADDEVAVTSRPKQQVAVRAHRHGGALYLFVASLSGEPVEVTLRLKKQKTGRVLRLDDRAAKQPKSEKLRGGSIRDELEPYGIRRYKVTR